VLKKVYISEPLEEGLFECKQDFPDASIYYCSELNFDDFCLAHQYSLFDDGMEKVFVGVDHYPAEKLLSLLEDGIEVPVNWIFKSLDKRTKLYKKFKTCSNIEEVYPLVKAKDKKEFIEQCFDELEISNKFLDQVYYISSDNRANIRRDLFKFKTALSVMSEEEAIHSLTFYKADSKTLDFISSLFSDSEFTTAKLARKIDKVPVPVVTSTLLKRLLSLIFLSKGDVKSAQMFWDKRGYFLNKDRSIAKQLGTKRLLEIYLYVDSIFSDFFRKESNHLKLLKLIRFVHSS
jgi:hypothetical protein